MANVLASKIRDVEILREILARDVEEGARRLLGCVLVMGEKTAQIVETEAYTWDDPGCHSYGRTAMKNMAMFARPGTAYIYFTYGNHWMLNVAAHPEGIPSAILIRAARPLTGIQAFRENRPGIVRETDLMNGPGKLAKAFGIDSALNGTDLLSSNGPLYIDTRDPILNIGVTRRIGLARGKGDELLRRYVDRDLLEYTTKHRLNFAILRDN